MDFLDLICKQNKISETFIPVQTTGIANNIYISDSYVLRIPTDHTEAISDALTEAVAVPVVCKHGIKTRKLLVFDNSNEIINKPYSIWEKVNGIPLCELSEVDYKNVWFELGLELSKLHFLVTNCDDPNNWLDKPDREYDIEYIINCVRNDNKSRYIEDTVKRINNNKLFDYNKCFVHGDTHSGNIICSEDDKLLSIIDWGDAGWADPAIDFYMIPIHSIYYVLKGYLTSNSTKVDNYFLNRIIMDKIAFYLDEKYDISIIESEIRKLNNVLESLYND